MTPDDPTDLFDTGEDQQAPICTCGVTAIPSDRPGPAGGGFVCENPECESYGRPVD